MKHREKKFESAKNISKCVSLLGTIPKFPEMALDPKTGFFVPALESTPISL